jgi:hypothetical protein
MATSTFDRHFIKQLTMADLYEWFILFDSKSTRAIRRSKWAKRLKKNKNDNAAAMHLEKVVLYKDITPAYILGTLVGLVCKVVLFILFANHLDARKDWTPVPFGLFSYPNLQDSIDYVLMAALLLLFLETSTSR